MGLRHFTRLTNAFSTKLENHYRALSLYFVFYKFLRISQDVKGRARNGSGRDGSPLVDGGYRRIDCRRRGSAAHR
jgi:hypothetical protein